MLLDWRVGHRRRATYMRCYVAAGKRTVHSRVLMYSKRVSKNKFIWHRRWIFYHCWFFELECGYNVIRRRNFRCPCRPHAGSSSFARGRPLPTSDCLDNPLGPSITILCNRVLLSVEIQTMTYGSYERHKRDASEHAHSARARAQGVVHNSWLRGETCNDRVRRFEYA